MGPSPGKSSNCSLTSKEPNVNNVDLYSYLVHELHQFGVLLREWRGRASPGGVGCTGQNGSRRTPGLRREELAELSLVSADYIKRLEQGRARPSLQVLRAVADALGLSRAEYEHLCILTGHAVAQPGRVDRRIRPATRQLLDRLDDVAVGVFDATWTLLSYNTLGDELCGDPAALGPRDRNMVWRYFTNTTNCVADSRRQELEYEASLVADLRETASRYPTDPGLTALIADLMKQSPRFAELWVTGATAKFAHRRGSIDHPELGLIHTDGHVLTVPEGDLKLYLFTVEPGSSDARKVAELAARAKSAR
ncbi:helix-turn-helix domain-containing protein [Nocardia terpenica]|uniref:helix-turn-helix domain-containing protein n=1 Tax=Nocardia terpenica TaxID=455432 RepID=UPI0009EED48E|nr:helix-turn-helix transcriptional regulator [Nocardia terpenica]NQE92388.1 helix-turn-helix domain-containing protein [Nocardia terpenica]